jgi:putative peptidoglycan lipid II flippase
MISALLGLPYLGVDQAGLGLGLAAAVTLSGAAQMGCVLWACRKAGVKIGLRRPRLTPGVKRLFILGVPGIFSAGITQINLLISHLIATFQQGAASWLTYADRLYQLPLGMIGIAMGIALLPALSRRIRAGDEEGAKTSLNRGIEIAAFLTLPAAAALFIIPDILIAGIYQRGEFVSDTTLQVAKALRFFALGLPAFVMIKVLTPAFFARENTTSPMIYAAISAVINIGFGLLLFWRIGFEGLALATTIAAWVNVYCLSRTLLRSAHWVPDSRLMSRTPRIALASLLMGIALWFAKPYMPDFGDLNLIADLFFLALICGTGGIIYIIAAMALRAFGVSDIRDAFSRNRA